MEMPKHTPQPYTLKLLGLGIIEFSETLENQEQYEIVFDHAILYCGDGIEMGTALVCTVNEIYLEEDDEFIGHTISFYEDFEDVDIEPGELEIYKKMQI